MKASIVLATKDRGPAIGETIHSLVRLDFPASEYEIIIVDNLSSPANQQELIRYRALHTDLVHYVREESLGLSIARNCGIRHSKGDIIAFLDDDAVAPEYWLKNLVKAFDHAPDVFAVGSKVVPIFVTPPPPWLTKRLGLYISNFDKGNQILTLHYNEYPRGTNMAFRREAFERCGCFSDSFGRKGDSLMSYEEIELCYRIEKAGYTVLYTPDAEVQHLIRGDRLNEEWFRSRFYWQGRSEGLFDAIHRSRMRTLMMFYIHLALSIIRPDHYSSLCHRGYVSSVWSSFAKSKSDRQIPGSILPD